MRSASLPVTVSSNQQPEFSPQPEPSCPRTAKLSWFIALTSTKTDSCVEDFCALLGLRPSAKYDTAWERIARAVRDHVPGSTQLQTFQQLATILLLTYALRNSDCHAKNIALLYSTRGDAHLSPVYDMITTVVYPGYQLNPPGISFMGKKTWASGKSLGKFITAVFGVPARIQAGIVEAISDAISEAAPRVREGMARHAEFADIGKRMLLAWSQGVNGLREKRVYSLSEW